MRCDGREVSCVRRFKYVFRENMELERRESDRQIKRKLFRDFLWSIYFVLLFFARSDSQCADKGKWVRGLRMRAISHTNKNKNN